MYGKLEGISGTVASKLAVEQWDPPDGPSGAGVQMDH
jgi:hypothetical protein